jgi:hypothetical protein
MANVSFSEAGRRYRRLFWPAMIAYLAICFGGVFLLKAIDEPAPWMSAGIALATAAPAVATIWLLARFIRETDEYTRKVQTEAMLSGGAITLSAAAVWGFLELYGAIPPMTDFPPVMLLWTAFFFFYGASFFVQQLRRGESLGDALKNDPLCLKRDIVG